MKLDQGEYISILIVLAIPIFFFIMLIIRIINPPCTRISSKLKQNLDEELLRYSSYYQKLSYEEKLRFQERVKYFIRYKRWIGKEGLIVTEIMKLNIAITAVQIAFGLDKMYHYEFFDKIYIYPNDYTSRATNKLHKGETSPFQGYVMLSWASYVEGNNIPTDTINVGIHEFAHALYLNQTRLNIDVDFKSEYEEWVFHVNKNSEAGKTQSVFRKYAFNNQMEFFAVALEYYFENPSNFNQQLPSLYNSMSELLNQNPLQPNNGIKKIY